MRAPFFLAAALAVAGVAGAAETPPTPPTSDSAWRLSEVGGHVACTLTLTARQDPGGFEVMAPLACRRAFPPLKDVSAWSFDALGGIDLFDAARKKIIAFPKSEGGPFEVKAPDGKTWRLEPARGVSVLPPHDRMSGAFRLTGAPGATLCDVTLTSNLFGTAGRITPSGCVAGWAEKGLAIWSLKNGLLTLMDQAHKPLLVLKAGEAATFTSADPRTEAITLARR